MSVLQEMQETAFNIIAHSGEAKSLFMEAIQAARLGNFEEAQKFISDGERVYSETHKMHFSLVQREAQGEELPFSLLLMHAEDQMLTTETIKVLAFEMIEIYRLLKEK